MTILGALGAVLLFAPPALAQPSLTPELKPDLNTTLGKEPKPPTVDHSRDDHSRDDRNTTQPSKQPTAKQPPPRADAPPVENDRASRRREAAEAAARTAEQDLAKERVAEKRRFHDRVMTAIYVGLGIFAVLGIWFLKGR